MKQFFNSIWTYFVRIYKLSLGAAKQDKLAWRALKKLHAESGWRSGVYESEQYIEATLEIADGHSALYYYMIFDREYHCRVRVFEDFSPEMTTDLFILATHLNNLLSSAGVRINVNDRAVEYNYKCYLLVPYLYPAEFYERMISHYIASKDIYWAFSKLIHENEEPAIIVADLLKKKEEEQVEK